MNDFDTDSYSFGDSVISRVALKTFNIIYIGTKHFRSIQI